MTLNKAFCTHCTTSPPSHQLVTELACFGYVQMQQYSQLEGLRQVACSRSWLDAVSRAEAELHGLSPHLPGHPQEVCPPSTSPTCGFVFSPLAALSIVGSNVPAHRWNFISSHLTEQSQEVLPSHHQSLSAAYSHTCRCTVCYAHTCSVTAVSAC